MIPTGPSSALRIASLVLPLVMGGCTLVSPGDTPGPISDRADAAPESVTRSYSGEFSVDGSTIPVTLTFTATGGEVTPARLDLPELDIQAVGEGRLQDGRLELRLEYPGSCRGELEIVAAVEDDGHALRGTMAAEDCTGGEEGGLVLLLRPEAGSSHRRR